MKRWQVALALGIVCCILALAISVQLKTIYAARENSNFSVSLTLTSNELRDQVFKWKEKYDRAIKNLEESENKLEDARFQSTQNDETALQKEESIKKANMILGLTDVKGKGLIIKLEDNSSITRSDIGPLDNIEWYLVHATDVVSVVNDLKNAGAEAIEINGQRIVESTGIYCAGNVLMVNNEKISSPIEIKAIGEPDLLYGSMTIPGGYLQIMQETGVIVTVKKSDEIKIQKFDGIIKAKEMRNE